MERPTDPIAAAGNSPDLPGVEIHVDGLCLPAREHSEQARCFWCHDLVETRRAWRCPSCAVLAHPGCGRELFRAVCPTPGCSSQAWSVARRDRGRPTWPRASRIALACVLVTSAIMFGVMRGIVAWTRRAAEEPRVAAVEPRPRVPDGSILLLRAHAEVPRRGPLAGWEAEWMLAHRVSGGEAAQVEAADAVGLAVAVTPRQRDCSILTTHGWRDGAPSTIETWFAHGVPIPVRRVERWSPAGCPGYGAVDERELVGIQVPQR